MNKRTNILIFALLTLTISIIPIAKVEAMDFKKLCKLYSQIRTREKIAIVAIVSYFLYNFLGSGNSQPDIPQQQNQNYQINNEEIKQIQDQFDGFCNEQTHNELKNNRGIYCDKCHLFL